MSDLVMPDCDWIIGEHAPTKCFYIYRFKDGKRECLDAWGNIAGEIELKSCTFSDQFGKIWRMDSRAKAEKSIAIFNERQPKVVKLEDCDWTVKTYRLNGTDYDYVYRVVDGKRQFLDEDGRTNNGKCGVGKDQDGSIWLLFKGVAPTALHKWKKQNPTPELHDALPGERWRIRISDNQFVFTRDTSGYREVMVGDTFKCCGVYWTISSINNNHLLAKEHGIDDERSFWHIDHASDGGGVTFIPKTLCYFPDPQKETVPLRLIEPLDGWKPVAMGTEVLPENKNTRKFKIDFLQYKPTEIVFGESGKDDRYWGYNDLIPWGSIKNPDYVVAAAAIKTEEEIKETPVPTPPLGTRGAYYAYRGSGGWGGRILPLPMAVHGVVEEISEPTKKSQPHKLLLLVLAALVARKLGLGDEAMVAAVLTGIGGYIGAKRGIV